MDWIKLVIIVAILFAATYIYLFVKSVLYGRQVSRLINIISDFHTFANPILEEQKMMFGIRFFYLGTQDQKSVMNFQV